MGLRPNARGPGLVTFGPDRVKEFCEANNLQMIIRAHECVMDGTPWRACTTLDAR